MAEIQWHEAVELINPYVVRIWTPQGKGTGMRVAETGAAYGTKRSKKKRSQEA